jgi:hypothetical protein
VSMNLLDRLLEHDSWTTRLFLDVAKQLTRDQLDSNCGIGHGTVRKTFEHVIWNVECWADLMKGDVVRRRPVGPLSIDGLIVRFDAASSKFVEFAREVSGRRHARRSSNEKIFRYHNRSCSNSWNASSGTIADHVSAAGDYESAGR